MKPETVRTGATERGYTMKLAKAVMGRERSIRMNKDESLHVFDKDGNEVVFFQGKGASVKGTAEDFAKIPQNSIITHNHPKALGKKGFLAIGNSFSIDDLNTAIKTNAAEMRAVTPTYTFSVKRPEKGWGVTSKQLAKVYSDALTKERMRGTSYAYKAKTNKEFDVRKDRYASVAFHNIMTNVAKQFGWDYTKKRG